MEKHSNRQEHHRQHQKQKKKFVFPPSRSSRIHLRAASVEKKPLLRCKREDAKKILYSSRDCTQVMAIRWKCEYKLVLDIIP
jgi:hypothetical protein